MSFIHVDLSGTMGALQIGSIFSIFMFGIVTLQTHIYYSIFPKDKWMYKALVAAIWCLELAHTGCIGYEVYRTTITLYGEPELITTFPVLGSATAVAGAITLLVQAYFSVRLYKVLPKPYSYIGIACIVLSTARFVASIYLSIRSVHAPNMITYRAQNAGLISALLASAAFVDVVIAVAMLKYLTQKREQGLDRMTTVVDRLIAYTIRTGLLTSVSAVIILICFQAMPANLVWLALYTFLAKLYSNSLLSALNARHKLREELTNSMPSVERFTHSKNGGMRRDGTVDPARFAYNASQVISIEMNTTTETQDDAKVPGSSSSYNLDQKV